MQVPPIRSTAWWSDTDTAFDDVRHSYESLVPTIDFAELTALVNAGALSEVKQSPPNMRRIHSSTSGRSTRRRRCNCSDTGRGSVTYMMGNNMIVERMCGAPRSHECTSERGIAMAASTRFLIVGAGGRVGATGYYAARQLVEMGLPVRAFVHRADERADELRALGAEIAVGDLRNFQVVRAALDGVQRAYFTYPITDGLLEATAIFAAAGKEAGLESMVNMSQLPARPDHASPASRQHWLAERLLDWSGIGVTHMRPSYFLENLIFFAAETIRAEGKIYLPYGQGRHAPVAGEDLARVAVGILTDPAAHRGKTYVPTGPVSLSLARNGDRFHPRAGAPCGVRGHPGRAVARDPLPTRNVSSLHRAHVTCGRGSSAG